MPPIISFNHYNIYRNLNLVPAGPFNVGHPTSISISLSNTGSDTGNAKIHLWWIGPTQGACPGPMMDLVAGSKLVPPCGPTQPILFSVQPNASGHATVSWIPSAADFPRTLGPSVPGCLFAQAEIMPSAPTYAGDASALNNWDPTYTLCAQHNIYIGT